MRSARIPAQEQYRLIMECRQSGLADHQWCVEHDIKPGTFYNWVKRLRQKGCTDLPPATGRSLKADERQEVVKVNFNNPDIFHHSELSLRDDVGYTTSIPDIPAMKLSVGNCILSIPNGTDPHLLAQTLKAMKELGC